MRVESDETIDGARDAETTVGETPVAAVGEPRTRAHSGATARTGDGTDFQNNASDEYLQ
jgi:hypothetical protein